MFENPLELIEPKSLAGELTADDTITDCDAGRVYVLPFWPPIIDCNKGHSHSS